MFVEKRYQGIYITPGSYIANNGSREAARLEIIFDLRDDGEDDSSICYASRRFPSTLDSSY